MLACVKYNWQKFFTFIWVRKTWLTKQAEYIYIYIFNLHSTGSTNSFPIILTNFSLYETFHLNIDYRCALYHVLTACCFHWILLKKGNMLFRSVLWYVKGKATTIIYCLELTYFHLLIPCKMLWPYFRNLSDSIAWW